MALLPSILLVLLLATPGSASAQYQFEVVHSFDGAGGGRSPAGALLEADDDNLYGTTVSGGATNAGVVFKIAPDRTFSIHHSLVFAEGRNPYAGLVQTANGTMYGTTSAGGAYSSGTFFATTTSGAFATYDLPPAQSCGTTVPSNGPRAPVAVGPDGNLYGPKPGIFVVPCGSTDGAVLRLTPSGILTAFPAPPGIVSPQSSLVVGGDGNLYGTANPAGEPDAAFSFTLTGAFTLLHQFTEAEGTSLEALVLAPGGDFYGTAIGGGQFGYGTVFRMTPTGAVTVLHEFEGLADGANPRGGLVVSSDGLLYGVASGGGAFGAGTIFTINPGGGFSVVYTFTGGAHGAGPSAALIETRDGSLYGTTAAGGSFGAGVVFRLKSTRTQPFIIMDTPAPGATIETSFGISGWAIDRGAFTGVGIDALHVYAYPNPGSGRAPLLLGAALHGNERADIGHLFGVQFRNSGFTLDVSYLPPDRYQIVVFGRSTVTAAFSAVASNLVTVVGPRSSPAMVLDRPVSGGTIGTTAAFTGWAVDLESPTGTGVDAVHVWADPGGGGAPQFLGAATYGLSRPDVGAVFGSHFANSGYSLIASITPGTYTLVAFARSTIAGAFTVAAVASNVTVQANSSSPVLWIDTPANNMIATRPFPVAGWAVDLSATNGAGIDGIHVWAVPVGGAPALFVGSAPYGSSRPDVGSYFGDSRFADSGYTLTVTAAQLGPGTYDLQVFGHSTVTGSFNVARVVRVTVQ